MFKLIAHRHDTTIVKPCIDRFRSLGELIFAEQDLRTGVLQDVEMFGRCKPPVQWHKYRADPGTGKHQGQHIRRIQPQKRNPVAMFHIKVVVEKARHPANALVESPVADIPAFEAYRCLFRLEIRPALDPVRQVHQASSVSPGS